MDSGKAKAASTLVVDLIGPLVACRQCKRLWVPLTYSKYKVPTWTFIVTFTYVEWMSAETLIPASLEGCPLLACMGLLTQKNTKGSQLPMFLLRPLHPIPRSMAPGLAKAGHAQRARRWEEATLLYVVISPPSLLLRSWREGFCVAGPHRGLGTPLRNAGSSSQTEFPVYSLSSHF